MRLLGAHSFHAYVSGCCLFRVMSLFGHPDHADSLGAAYPIHVIWP